MGVYFQVFGITVVYIIFGNINLKLSKDYDVNKNN